MLNRSMQNTPFPDQAEGPLSLPLPVASGLYRRGVNASVNLVYGPALLLLLAACGGGSGGSQPEPVTADLSGDMATGVYILKGQDGQAKVVEITGDMDAVAVDKALTSAGVRTNAEDGTTILKSDIIAHYPDAVLNPSGNLPPGKTIAIYTGDSNGQTADGTTNLFLAAPGANSYNPDPAGDHILSYAYAPTGIDIDLSLVGTGDPQASPKDSSSGSWAHGDAIGQYVNHIIGSDHRDSILGDAEDNVIEGRGGPDNLDGRVGTDTLSFASSDDGVTVSLTTGTGSGGHAEGDTYTGFENIIGSRHNDELTGSPDVANRFTGGLGADMIHGGAETAGTDDEEDHVLYTGSKAGVTVNLNDGTTSSGGEAEGDKLTAIEHATGSKHDDIFIASADENDLYGGAGTDTVSYAASASGVTVNIGTNVNAGGAAGDSFDSIENVIGSDHSDTITGDGGDNVIEGGASPDVTPAVRAVYDGAINLAVKTAGPSGNSKKLRLVFDNSAPVVNTAPEVAEQNDIITVTIDEAESLTLADLAAAINAAGVSVTATVDDGRSGDELMKARTQQTDGGVNETTASLDIGGLTFTATTAGAAGSQTVRFAYDADATAVVVAAGTGDDDGVVIITFGPDGASFAEIDAVVKVASGLGLQTTLADTAGPSAVAAAGSHELAGGVDADSQNNIDAKAASVSVNGLTFTAKAVGVGENGIEIKFAVGAPGSSVAVAEDTTANTVTITVPFGGTTLKAITDAVAAFNTNNGLTDVDVTLAETPTLELIETSSAQLSAGADGVDGQPGGGDDTQATESLNGLTFTAKAESDGGQDGTDGNSFFTVSFAYDPAQISAGVTAALANTHQTSGDTNTPIIAQEVTITLGPGGASLADIIAAVNAVSNVPLTASLETPGTEENMLRFTADAGADRLIVISPETTNKNDEYELSATDLAAAAVKGDGFVITADADGTAGNGVDIIWAVDADANAAAVAVTAVTTSGSESVTITLNKSGATLQQIADKVNEAGTDAAGLVTMTVEADKQDKHITVLQGTTADGDNTVLALAGGTAASIEGDVIDGGAGNDTASYASSSEGVTVDLDGLPPRCPQQR